MDESAGHRVRSAAISLLWPLSDSPAAVAYPSEKMASTSKPNTPNLEGAAAAAAPWTPTGGRKITVHKQHANTGNYYLEIRYTPRASSKRADLKSITSLHEDYPGKPGFLGCYHQKSWVTEAAARAAIDHFRAWVDGGRRKQTAAATARSNQPAAEDVVLLPERYSERRNFRVWVDAMLRPVSRASGVVVKLMLLTSVHTTTRDDYNRAWSRSSDALRAVRKRRAPTFDVLPCRRVKLYLRSPLICQ